MNDKPDLNTLIRNFGEENGVLGIQILSFDNHLIAEYYAKGLDKTSIESLTHYSLKLISQINHNHPLDDKAYYDLDGRAIAYQVFAYHQEMMIACVLINGDNDYTKLLPKLISFLKRH